MNESSVVREESQGPSGIKGWLIIPAIGLVLAPIKSAVMLFLGLHMIKAVSPEFLNDPRLWINGLIDVAMIIACIVVAVLFFSHRRLAVKAIIALMSVLIAANLTQLLLNTSMFGRETIADSIKSVVHACVFAAVWIPYFLKSKRVRNTFVE